ncbi:MAG: oligosaccharide flippase family protein [Polyangiaceae bacterium]
MAYPVGPVSLARQAAGGFAWATATTVIARLLTVASTFALTRFLAPEEPGEVNLAFVLGSSAGAATAFGVGQYVAAHPRAGRDVGFHGTLLVVVAGVLSCLFSVAVAREAGSVMGCPGMAEYVPGLALAHFLERLGWVPRSLLVREMRFRAVGLRLAAGELTFAVTSVWLAAGGAGGDAIVFGNIARASLGTAYLLWATAPRDHLWPHPLSRGTLRRMLSFGLPITAAQFFRIGATSWDNSLMGMRFGEAAVGVYNQAYRLAELPAASVGDPLNDVLVPTFARLVDPAARRRGYFRAVSLVALIVLPMSAGLAVVAGDLVRVFYPPSYREVGPFLTALAGIGVARGISSLSGAYLQSMGRTRPAALSELALVACVLGAMTMLSRLGAVAAAAGVTAAFFVHAGVVVRALSSEGIALASVARAAARPAAACAPMVAAVSGLGWALGEMGVRPGAALGAEIVAGAAVYSVAAWVVARPVVRDFAAVAASVVSRRGASARG